MTNKKYEGFVESLKKGVVFAVEAAKLDFALDVDRLIQRNGMKRSDLASAIQKSRPYVTKLLRGDGNPTIETMVKIVHALGGQVHIKITAADEQLGFIRINEQTLREVMRRKQGAARTPVAAHGRFSVADFSKRVGGKAMCANDDGYDIETAEAA